MFDLFVNGDWEYALSLVYGLEASDKHRRVVASGGVNLRRCRGAVRGGGAPGAASRCAATLAPVYKTPASTAEIVISAWQNWLF